MQSIILIYNHLSSPHDKLLIGQVVSEIEKRIIVKLYQESQLMDDCDRFIMGFTNKK